MVTKSQLFNLSLLAVFSLSTFLMIMFHFTRIYKSLLKRGAFTLGNICLLKAFLLLFDLGTNAFLLYSVLVTKGSDLFSYDLLTTLTLIIVASSMFITLSTNVIVNFPLHVTFINMLLKTRVPHSIRSQLSRSRVYAAAAKKTFHPAILAVFGLFCVYNLGSLGYVLMKTRNFQLEDVITVGTNLGQSNLLYAALWINLIANYLFGVIGLAVYILYLPCFLLKK